MLVIPGRAEGANPESINAVVSGLILPENSSEIVMMNCRLGAGAAPE
jgi:hypothetical protein